MNVVALGGGHGLARTLEALLQLGHRPTAVVSVADDGGSSGRLRAESRDLVALGDMRMALATIAEDEVHAALVSHRFTAGVLRGHALGNLMLIALLEQHDGDLVAAMDAAAVLLGARGRVLPCTTSSVHLAAEIDGAVVTGQVAIATTAGAKSRLWLQPPDPPACAAAVAALRAADAIVMGPGSLFTSILPNLLVAGIAHAVAAAAADGAALCYVANLTTQPGETEGMSLQAHLDALLARIPGAAMVLPVLHEGPRPVGPGVALAPPLEGPRIAPPICADVARRRADGRAGGGHDPERLAAALAPLLRPRRSGAGDER